MNARGDKLRIGILASGEGTTLQSILDASARGQLDAEVAVVISNNHGSGALKKAEASSVKAVYLSSKTHPDAHDLDSVIYGTLLEAGVDLVVLAGYMKKVGPGTLAAYGGRILNTHPAYFRNMAARACTVDGYTKPCWLLVSQRRVSPSIRWTRNTRPRPRRGTNASPSPERP